MAKIDDIDKQILAFLHEDAFMSNKEMASRLGLSATPVHERIKRMEKEGVITGYKATINPNKLGKSLTVFCDISLKEHAAEYLNQFDDLKFDNVCGPVSINQSNNTGINNSLQRNLDFVNGYSEFQKNDI